MDGHLQDMGPGPMVVGAMHSRRYMCRGVSWLQRRLLAVLCFPSQDKIREDAERGEKCDVEKVRMIMAWYGPRSCYPLIKRQTPGERER